MTRPFRPVALALLLAFSPARAPFSGAAAIPSPESVLGFRPGDDRRLADWGQIVDYFHRLAAASDRVRVEEVGRTPEGRPFLVVVLSSADNLRRLEDLRRDNLRLWDPRGLAPAEARRLLGTGRAVVALLHGIHSTEVASTQTALETAYVLASAREGRLLEILEATLVLIVPSQNPDGTQAVTEWYRRTLGTPFEGAAPPFLYHAYAGHDDNRDAYMFALEETRLVARQVYDRWRPQIVHDLHQMGARGARLFVPPYVDPWEPNVDPALRAAANALGAHVAARLQDEGKRGVVLGALFDAWAPARAYAHTHGGVRLLSECASARLASPLEVPFERLEPGRGYDPRRASWNFPFPWPGGTWRLRDAVDYQLSASLAVLEHAARQREDWLRRFLEVNRRACARREPFAFVAPAAQADPLAAARLFQALRTGAVEVARARAAFTAGGESFPAGSHVVLMSQPASAFAKTLLEPQQYPELREHAGGPPLRPYDVAAHTLPLLLGVAVRAIDAPFTAELEPLDEVSVTPGRVTGRGASLALGHKTGAMFALGRLLAADVPVRWALDAFVSDGRRFEPGTLLVPAAARRRVLDLARELGVDAQAVDARPRALRLHRPRVGLYRSWVPSPDEGWTRYVFEREARVEYVTLRDADLRAGDLRRRFDVLLLPDQPADRILAGHAAGSLPAEYTGGIGDEGLQALRAFVQAGGTLVALNRAAALPLAHFGLPARDVLAGVGPEGPDGFACPGSILRTRVDPAHPLAHGLGPTSIVWFEDGPAFEFQAGRAVLRYDEPEPLLSGFLLGGRRLQGRAALLELPLGRGRVVLFGFRPQYRAQSWATYLTLLNAVYTSSADEER